MIRLSPPDLSSRPLLLMDCESRTMAALEKSLPRMGGQWQILNEDAALSSLDWFAVLVEVDEFSSPRALEQLRNNAVPIIAVISHEALSQIERALNLGATALLSKPINQRAIYTTLMMATGIRQQLQQNSEVIERLEQRLTHLPQISQAIAALMVAHHIDESTAWNTLRREAMANNLTMADLAEKILLQTSILQKGSR